MGNETYSDISPFPGTFLGEPTSMNYLKYMFWACSGAPVHTAIPPRHSLRFHLEYRAAAVGTPFLGGTVKIAVRVAD